MLRLAGRQQVGVVRKYRLLKLGMVLLSCNQPDRDQATFLFQDNHKSDYELASQEFSIRRI